MRRELPRIAILTALLIPTPGLVYAADLCAELHPEARHVIRLDEPIIDSDGDEIIGIRRRQKESDYEAFTSCFNRRYRAAITAREFLACYHVPKGDAIGRVTCYMEWDDRLITSEVCKELGIADDYNYFFSDCYNEFQVLSGREQMDPADYAGPPKSFEQIKAEMLELQPQIEELLDGMLEKFQRDIERQATSGETM